MEPTRQDFFGRLNKRDASELGVSSPVADPTESPACIDERQPIVSTEHSPNTTSSHFSGGYERQVVTAGIILTIQVQLLTTSSMVITTTTRGLLSIGVILELLGILLAICLVHSHHPDESRPPQPLSMLVRIMSGVPIVLILTGIIGLAVALVVETLKTSLSTAVVMGGFIISGIILCILASVRGPWKHIA